METKPPEPPPTLLPPSSNWRSLLGVAAFYLGMTILLTMPLIFSLASSVPSGSIEDRYQNFWNFWWVGRALSNFHNPFETNVLFYPYYNDVPLYLHTLQLLNCVIVLPLTALFGVAAAYNGTILFAFTLSGFGTFLLAHQITRQFWAAILAGIIYTFSVSHFDSVKTSITNIMSIQWLPLYAWALWKWYEQPSSHSERSEESETLGFAQSDRLNIKWLFVAALFLAACAYTDWYNTLYLLFYTAFFYLGTALMRATSVLRFFQTLFSPKQLPIIGAVLSGIIMAAPAFIGAFATLNSPIYAAQFDLNRDIRASKTLLEVVNLTTVTGVLFWVGLVIGIALVVGRRKWARFWLGFYLLCHLFTLGPRLQIDQLNGAANPSDVPLPYALFKLLPGASVMRAPDRFDIPAQLALAMLVALAMLWVLDARRVAQLSRWIKAGLGVGLAMLYLLAINPAPMGLTMVEPSPFVKFLPKEGEYAVLELPITRHYNFDHERMLNQTYYRRPIMGGYLARPVLSPYRTPDSPFKYLADQAYAQGDPTREIFPPQYYYATVDNIARLYNFRYIALYKNDYRSERERDTIKQLIEGRIGKESLVMEDGGYALYKVPDSLWQKPVTPALFLGEGWYEVEQNRDGLYRWTRQAADFYITVAQPTRVKLTLAIRSFGGDRPARLLFGGQKVVWEARLTPAGESVTVEVDLPQGTSRFSLESLTPAQTGQATGLSTDNRPLAFLVNSIKMS